MCWGPELHKMWGSFCQTNVQKLVLVVFQIIKAIKVVGMSMVEMNESDLMEMSFWCIYEYVKSIQDGLGLKLIKLVVQLGCGLVG
jgi:hypothetical protein